MLRLRPATRSFIIAVTCFALVIEASHLGFAQQAAVPKKSQSKRKPARKSVAPSSLRPKSIIEEKTAADRIVLKDGKELFGQVDDSSSSNTSLRILARRELIKASLPDWATKWENAEKGSSTAASNQRRERLAGWRRERAPEAEPGDHITAWLDRELAGPSRSTASSPLMAIQLGRSDVTTVQRRSQPAAQALRLAWLLGIAAPENVSPAKLKDLIAGRGAILDSDEPVAIDALLPPMAESIDHWLLRRAATEVLHDEGLRWIAFGSTTLPEPIPGQPLDPALGATLIEGTIRDALGVGVTQSLPSRLRAAADRGRVGVMVTRIAIAADLGSVSAESSMYYHNGSDWDRGVWRSETLQVGAVPAVVVSMVANDPQVKAVMNLIDMIGAGFVSPDMKERGLIVGTTIGGAVVLARTALVRALALVAFDVEAKATSRSPRNTSAAQ